jgi:hypothetical protein
LVVVEQCQFCEPSLFGFRDLRSSKYLRGGIFGPDVVGSAGPGF